MTPDFSGVSGGSENVDQTKTASATTYTVKPGDSLSKIAADHYGKASDWNKIYEANRDTIKDPDKIFPGQELNLPQ